MVYLFLANGFEEAEALVPCDILRRAGCDVMLTGVGAKKITGSHGIHVECDITVEEVSVTNMEMIILPGGMPGTSHLFESKHVRSAITYAADNDIFIAAICAAPSILGRLGYLKGRRATCFPGFEKYLLGAYHAEDLVVTDGKIITAKGMGVALEFGLTLAAALKGEQTANEIKAAVQCR